MPGGKVPRNAQAMRAQSAVMGVSLIVARTAGMITGLSARNRQADARRSHTPDTWHQVRQRTA
jgi:hypothetical protein